MSSGPPLRDDQQISSPTESSAPPQKFIDYKSDKSLTSATQDKFKHSHYVKVLKDILTKCDTPINIGLYGRWGVGKSSIVHMLREEIDNGILGKEFAYVEVDTWGLSKDALQQGILEEINSHLKAYKQSAIEDFLYNEREVESRDYKAILKRLWFFGGIASAIGVIYFSFSSVDLIQKITALGIGTVVTALLPLLKLFEVSSKRLIPRAVSSYRFNEIYEKMVNKIVAQNKKLVVVIDNLDRCDDYVAVALLGIIQTFMAKPNCINILACDDEAIVNHLHRVHGDRYTEREGNEFLSKFFQVTIRIPPFIGENLEEYTQELMDKRSIPLDPFVRQILISGAVENPRKINQFLNNVMALYRLAEMKENDGKLSNGVITKHTDFLTKIIILRHEWPLFYKVLEKQPTLLNDRTELKKWLETSSPSEKSQNEGLERFLNVTRFSSVNDISPFLRLNQETYASESAIDEFAQAANSNDLDAAMKMFEPADELKRQHYLKKLEDLNNKHAESSDYLTLINSASVLLGLLDVIGDERQRKIVLANLGNHVSTLLLDHLDKMEKDKLIKVLPEMFLDFSRPIYYKIMDSNMTPENFNELIIRNLLEHGEITSSDIMTELDGRLSEQIAVHRDAVTTIITDLCNRSLWINNNIRKPSKSIARLISLIALADLDTTEQADSILNIQAGIDISEMRVFVERIIAIIREATGISALLPEKIFTIVLNIQLNNENVKALVIDICLALIDNTISSANSDQTKRIFELLLETSRRLRE